MSAAAWGTELLDYSNWQLPPNDSDAAVPPAQSNKIARQYAGQSKTDVPPGRYAFQEQEAFPELPAPIITHISC